VDPAGQRAEDVLDAAVQGAAAMVVSQYYEEFPEAKPPDGAEPGGLVGRLELGFGSRPRLKRLVRELSSRSAAVRGLRVLAWRELERARARRRA
jgi:hypothetical protein